MVELAGAVYTPGDICGSKAGHAAGEGVRAEPGSGYRGVKRAGGRAAPDSAGLLLLASLRDTGHRVSFISVSFCRSPGPSQALGMSRGTRYLTLVGEDA